MPCTCDRHHCAAALTTLWLLSSELVPSCWHFDLQVISCTFGCAVTAGADREAQHQETCANLSAALQAVRALREAKAKTAGAVMRPAALWLIHNVRQP